MISESLAQKIGRDLAAGKLSDQEIADKRGVSRSTVQNIKYGKWKPRPKREQLPPEVAYEVRGYTRCKGCGNLRQVVADGELDAIVSDVCRACARSNEEAVKRAVQACSERGGLPRNPTLPPSNAFNRFCVPFSAPAWQTHCV